MGNNHEKDKNNSKLGLIMGSNKFGLDKLDTYSVQKIETEFGSTTLNIGNKCVILSRHGESNDIPPHMINHHSNMKAFKELGVERIISCTSVGSLKLNLEPTHIVVPDDYINIGPILTYFDSKTHHIMPSLNASLRQDLITIIKQIPILATITHYNGIYIQTQGPRLETKAEIQMLKNFGDVVGMTMAAEATLAKELKLKYANICIVDNYCNGLVDEPLTIQTIQNNQVKNSENLTKIIQKILNQ